MFSKTASFLHFQSHQIVTANSVLSLCGALPRLLSRIHQSSHSLNVRVLALASMFGEIAFQISIALGHLQKICYRSSSSF